MTTIAGSTVLVTGGARGIGLRTAQRLLEAGARHLVLWDVNDTALRDVVRDLASVGHRVDGARVDVAEPAQLRMALRRLRERGIAIDVLVNNAGVVVGKDFADHSHDDIDRTMAVNALAPMHLALELLPGMLARGHGHVVNVSSAAGMLSNPHMSVYCASKWALTGWSDTLRLEMQRARTGVHVTTVMPYYVSTGMFAGVRTRMLPMLDPDRVAREIVAAIRKDRIVLRLPRVLHLLPLARGLLPTRWFDRIIGEWAGVYRSMSTFRGHTPEITESRGA